MNLFWTIVWAVVVALIVLSIIMWLVGLLLWGTLGHKAQPYIQQARSSMGAPSRA